MGGSPAKMRALWICLWTGPVLCALFAVAMVVLAGIIPPTDPTDSAEEIAAFFQSDVDAIRLGLALGIVAMALIAPFGIAIAEMLRESERGTSLLTNIQIASVAIGTSVAVIMCLVWGTAAYRPDEYDPETTLMLNDLAWFFFLFSWAPFSIWIAAVGLAIISDERANPPFPRWVAYLNFWLAILFMPAALMIFFKTGAFAYNGAVAFYVPTIAFFGWVMIMSVLARRALSRSSALPAEVASPEAEAPRVPVAN